jgi:hypothetical protein
MAKEDFYRYRGAVGSLTRSCSADDPKLVHARAVMTVKDDTSAFLNALQESWEAAERGENDESSRPKPSKTDIAAEVTTHSPSPLRHFSTTRRPACSPDSDAPSDAFSSRSVST